MLAGRLWSKVLAEELGAGREKGGPARAGPGEGSALAGGGWTRWRAPAGVQTIPARRAKLHLGLAGPRRGSPRLQAGDRPPGRTSRHPPRPPPPPPPGPERLFALAGFLLPRYPTPDSGWKGGTVRPRVKRLGGAEETTPGSHRRRGKPGRFGYRGRATPPPRFPLSPRRTPGSGNPRLLGASGIVRFGVTPGDLSPRFGGRGASPKLAG
ncbi:hypothetical protein AB1E18_009714 [Capra hircus]